MLVTRHPQAYIGGSSGNTTRGRPDMAHTPQEIFKVIILHNRLCPEDEIDALLAQTHDPERVLADMVTAEMISPSTAGKVDALYRRNLEKVGLPVPTTP